MTRPSLRLAGACARCLSAVSKGVSQCMDFGDTQVGCSNALNAQVGRLFATLPTTKRQPDRGCSGSLGSTVPGDLSRIYDEGINAWSGRNVPRRCSTSS